MKDDTHKSDMRKGKRLLMTDDIASFVKRNPVPAPNAFTPRPKVVQKNISGTSYNQKDKRVSLYEESVWRSQQAPGSYHYKNHVHVDKKVVSPAYKKAIKPDYDVACFLKVKDPATKLISPVTYNNLASFKQTQVKTLRFGFRPRQKDSIDMSVKRA